MKNSARATEAAVQQDREIADFLRYFVGGDRQAGHDAEVNVGQKRGADQYAVDEIVQAIAKENQNGGGLPVRLLVRRVHLAVLGVAMPPQYQFLQEEKSEQAVQHGCGYAMDVGAAAFREGVRQQSEQRGAQQRTDGQADEMRKQLQSQPLGQDQEDGRRNDAQHTAEQAEQQYPGQQGEHRQGSGKQGVMI